MKAVAPAKALLHVGKDSGHSPAGNGERLELGAPPGLREEGAVVKGLLRIFAPEEGPLWATRVGGFQGCVYFCNLTPLSPPPPHKHTPFPPVPASPLPPGTGHL